MLTIAHRGFSGRHPENTLAAVTAAIRAGADAVEVDVQQTADGELVVFHDYSLRRLCGLPGRVDSITWTHLHQQNPAIPTLQQVLRQCRHRTRVVVEIKGASVRDVVGLIRRTNMERQVTLFTFSPRKLHELAELAPEWERFALLDRPLPRRVTDIPVAVAGIAGAQRLFRSVADVRRLHQLGWRVWVWTVNDPRRLARFQRWGVDGIITNHPDRVTVRTSSRAGTRRSSRSS